MLKDNGQERESKKKKHKKYRDIKCDDKFCKGKIDVDYAIEVGDIEYCDNLKTSIYVYCPICGLNHKVELKK
jgi:hypothetical protein